MFNKYIKINEKKISVGQDGKTGGWYCKNLDAETTSELKVLIGEVNEILNTYNQKTDEDGGDKKKSPSSKKTG